MRPVLVLRPEPGASVTVDRAHELGLDAFAVPLFEIEPVAWNPPDPAQFDGVLLTSANSVRHAGEQIKALNALPVYAVGAATADAARDAGFEIALAGEGGVDRLLNLVPPGLRLLHLCGEYRRMPANPSHTITPLVVQAARPIEAPDLSAASDVVTMIHSPRAGTRFAELISERETILIAAISDEAARAVGGGWAHVEVATYLNDYGLLALAARLCDKPLPE
ncbi:MAG TPA: uroporphyrinogen-III synthase [Sphingomicrobium sp.]|nr:uroporphyrinogen-III synthase [Sphingomicrobium sp.]